MVRAIDSIVDVRTWLPISGRKGGDYHAREGGTRSPIRCQFTRNTGSRANRRGSTPSAALVAIDHGGKGDTVQKSALKHFFTIVSGNVEMIVGDSSSRILGPGDVALLENVQGEGHQSRMLEDAIAFVRGVELARSAVDEGSESEVRRAAEGEIPHSARRILPHQVRPVRPDLVQVERG